MRGWVKQGEKRCQMTAARTHLLNSTAQHRQFCLDALLGSLQLCYRVDEGGTSSVHSLQSDQSVDLQAGH